ncbi:MAG: terminase small subunit-like protein, partial [Phenylobacterium sp.]
LETANAICTRLCLGERVKDIMADPDMPGYSTYFRWQKDFPEFRRAVAMAREICALRIAEEGWEDACAVTPANAFATRVKLEHLRWYAGKLSPKRYGPVRPRDAGKEGAHAVMHVYAKRFTGPDEGGGEGAGGEGRWSDEPARHLYSMIPEGDPSPRAGEALPPPAVVREPASTQGPDARGEARGGSVEVEFEDGAGADDPEDDYWSAP